MGQYRDIEYQKIGKGNRYRDIALNTYKEGSDDERPNQESNILNKPFMPSEFYTRGTGSRDHISLSKIEEIKAKAEEGRIYLLSRIVPYGKKIYQ
jgi:hypothetical protein